MSNKEKYTQAEISTISAEQKDILVAQLAQLGYEFEEERLMLKAFIRTDHFDAEALHNICSRQKVIYTLSTIDARNWNAEWEAGFQPVEVDRFCRIRAAFHPAVPGFLYDLVITPQMSFGTGHHATTYMMVQAMQHLEIKNKQVFDFGTGTGILAILAAKMGAAAVVAIDNDDWSIENARDNFERNDTGHILLEKSDMLRSDKKFDLILANINRNVILKNLDPIKQHLAPGGVVLFSGLLEADRETVVEAAKKVALELLSMSERDSWICLTMR